MLLLKLRRHVVVRRWIRQAASKSFTDEQVAQLTPHAVTASLGCGNPVPFAGLRPGETVLDLGSGGGIDVFLAAKLVGPAGFVIGLDMTDDMLE